jgi:hypothetical protein
MKKLMLFLVVAIMLFSCEKYEQEEVDNSDLIRIAIDRDGYTCYKYKYTTNPDEYKSELINVFTCFDTTLKNFNGLDPILLKLGIEDYACQECFKNNLD